VLLDARSCRSRVRRVARDCVGVRETPGSDFCQIRVMRRSCGAILYRGLHLTTRARGFTWSQIFHARSQTLLNVNARSCEHLRRVANL
jgi:hypothetical protein